MDVRAERREQKKHGLVLARQKPEEVSVNTWLSGFRHLFPGEAQEEAWKNERYYLMPFRREHGKLKVREVTPMLAQAWALEHPSQVRILKRAWEKATLMRVAEWNVWRVVELPRRGTMGRKEAVRAPSHTELAVVLAECSSREVAEPWWGHFAALVQVAAFTGARQSGLLRLEKPDVDLAGRRMVVTEKGDRTRSMFLPAPAVAALERALAFRSEYCDCRALSLLDERARCRACGRHRYLGGRHSQGISMVFRSRTAQKLSADRVQEAWRDVRGEYLHGFHGLKHYAASWLVDHGVDELDVAIQLGHTDREGRPYKSLVRRVYSHPDPDIALERIAKAVG